jgi:hypothetical protein
MRFSGTGRMPATGYLHGLTNDFLPPTGYNSSARMKYYADSFFGVDYQPLNNAGQNLGIDLHQSNWYIFAK